MRVPVLADLSTSTGTSALIWPWFGADTVRTFTARARVCVGTVRAFTARARRWQARARVAERADIWAPCKQGHIAGRVTAVAST